MGKRPYIIPYPVKSGIQATLTRLWQEREEEKADHPCHGPFEAKQQKTGRWTHKVVNVKGRLVRRAKSLSSAQRKARALTDKHLLWIMTKEDAHGPYTDAFGFKP